MKTYCILKYKCRKKGEFSGREMGIYAAEKKISKGGNRESGFYNDFFPFFGRLFCGREEA